MKVISEYETKYGICSLVYDYSDGTYCVIFANRITSACYAYFSLHSAEKAYAEMCNTIEE